MNGREGLEGGPGEQIALEEADLLTDKELIFGEGFHPFGDDVDVEVVAGATDGAEDVLTGPGALDAADEAHIEFDEVGVEVVEKSKAGVSGAEVVDGKANATGADLFEQGGEVGAAVDDGRFGEFENDVVERHAGGMRGFDGGEQRPGTGFETQGKKIEMQGAIDAEARGERDGGGAGDLIEEMKAKRRNLIQDLPGRLVPRATNEGFPADDFVRDAVDDGLEGEAKSRVGGIAQIGAHGARIPWS